MRFVPYNKGNHWSVPLAPDFVKTQATCCEKPGVYAVDGRGAWFQLGFSTVKHLGQGQFSLFTIQDGDGKPLDGGASYRLSVPARAPARQSWSATVDDRATHGVIRSVPRLRTRPPPARD